MQQEPGGRGSEPTWASPGKYGEAHSAGPRGEGSWNSRKSTAKAQSGSLSAKKVNMVGDEAGPAGRLQVIQHLILQVRR